MRINKLYLFAATAMVLASCSSSDELGSPTSSKKAITFESPFVSKTSRATGDLNNSNINSTNIKVWGDQYAKNATGSAITSANVFSNEPATLSYDGSAWKCDRLAFWESDKSYDFTAVAPATLQNVNFGEANAESFTLADRKLTISDIPVVQVINNGSDAQAKSGDDILVACANKQTEASKTVQLSFKHILSRFNIYIYSSDVENPTDADNVTVKDLAIYMPTASAKATYKQAAHGAVNPGSDLWSWNGFTNVENAENVEALGENYQKFEVINKETRLVYAASPSDAVQKKETLASPEFFIAPTKKITDATTADLQLYLAVTYVSHKTGWDTRTKTLFVPIQDLHSFKQGCQTNLFINLHMYQFSPQPLDFGSMTLDDWSTPNDGQFDVH